MEGELVDLAVIELDGADHLRRCEQYATSLPEAAVGGEAWVLSEPPRDCGGIDVVAEAGRHACCGLGQAVTAIVERERFENFRQGIRLVAQSPRAWCEGAAARAATKEAHGLEFFLASTARRDLASASVAVRAAVGWFDRTEIWHTLWVQMAYGSPSRKRGLIIFDWRDLH
jgi:hypothetical protein